MTYKAFTQAERQGWHDRAEVYATHTARATVQIIPAMFDALSVRPEQRLLDVACGPGYVAGAAAALDVDVEGIDYAPGMVGAARKRFPHLKFNVGNAEALPAQDASFEAVACNMGLFHMGDPQLAMREAFRVLRPSGRFSFSQWTAPQDSELYARLFAALKDEADLSRADTAPDAYVLSDPAAVEKMMKNAGFSQMGTRRLDTKLIAHGDDFFDFFMQFGVRVPLIVAAQDSDVKTRLRTRINADMAPYRTGTGFEVPMPSLLYTGTKQ
ncbi:putative methyltransferase protein [Sulfitobacter noctilucicola]|uniref:Ubiquinone/menaquinone biosynthesis C-methylase UbiE n=1 Tax=Sulfitobacter noctilucicola TaxID=1342301 RepID=A0A7W6Q4I5_9RHOB|nr:methyltransferase domain-containing protein [Sulfitobacter noctilucicola]KIN62599.1 putative methyltransferase protein [Sulfitobacter noctilucicola]MBB4172867.1 ubiquinone/menaquinone biosynthesis C-methylase UbiE [Sulfitobacter noctilucicola]